MEDNVIGDEKSNNGSRKCNIHINRSHIPLKLIYLFFMAGESCALLYRSVYMKHLGMSTKQTGIIWTLERIISILLPPLLGAITDKTRRPKLVLIILLLGGGGTLFSMYFVPQEEMIASGWNVSLSQQDVYNGNISFCWNIRCDTKFASDEEYCILQNPASNDKDCQIDSTNVGSLSCTPVTDMNPNIYPNFTSDIENNSLIFDDSITSIEIDASTLMNSTDSENTLFVAVVPTDSFSKCNPQTPDKNSTFPTFLLSPGQVDKLYNDLLSQAAVFMVPESALLCIDYDLTNPYANDQGTCNEVVQSNVDEYGVTFWLLISLVFISSFASIGSYPVIEASVLGALGPEKRHRFGHQRLWASVGFGSAALIVGYLKDRSQAEIGLAENSNRPFLSMFVGVLICWTCASIVAANLPIKTAKKKSSKVRLKDIKEVLKRGKAIAFFGLILFYGANIAVQEVYLFWLAEVKLNAPSFILGASTFIGALLDIPFCLAAGRLIKKFGHALLICFGMIVFSLRMIFCGIVTEPWQLVVVETSRCITWGLTWVVVCSYTAKISPRGLEVSTMGITQAMLWGVGYSAGALFGGVFFQIIGGDKLFVLIGGLSMCASILFGIFTFFTRNKNDNDVTSLEDKGLNDDNTSLKFEEPYDDDGEVVIA